LAARKRLAGIISVTPCAYSETISQMARARALFKLENLQMTGSFKERGAANKLLTLSETERARGVVAASAGNHGLAVAFHARKLKIQATIVMPEWAPLIKVTSARRDGARVILAGSDYDEAANEAQRLCRERGATFVHPFDDPEVIAGQGTLGLELLEQEPDLDAVIVPVGGGGLIGGVAMAIKETTARVRVVGVQAKNLAAMHASLAAGRIEEAVAAPTIADGIAVRRVGALTFPLVQRYVDEIVTVSEEEIANAILLLLEIEKTVVEGAGATTLAALLNRDLGLQDRRVAMILSGGNIDVNVISQIIEKGLVKDGRRVRLTVLLQDRPGSLARLTALVAGERANILEIEHHRAFAHAEIGETEVELTLETSGRDQIREVIDSLTRSGYRVREV
jgi:threonine dehydratase